MVYDASEEYAIQRLSVWHVSEDDKLCHPSLYFRWLFLDCSCAWNVYYIECRVIVFGAVEASRNMELYLPR